MLSSSTDWKTYLAKNVVKNCDVKAYSNAGTLLFNKDNIFSYKITSRNSYVCENIPSDNCIIVLNGNYSYNKKTIIKISYTLENEETSTCKVLIVETCDYDSKLGRTTIKLVSPFRLACNSEDYYNNKTVAERFQLEAISKGQGIRIPSISKSSSFSYYKTSLDGYYDFSDFEKMSIKEATIIYFDTDYSIEKNSYNLSQESDENYVVYYGYNAGTQTLIQNYSKTTGTPSIDKTFTFSSDYVITRYVTKKKNGAFWTNDYTVYSEDFECYGLNGIYIGYMPSGTVDGVGVEIYGYPLVQEQPSIYTSDKVAITPLVDDSGGEISSLQKYANIYWEDNKLYKFSGRINPRFEPLDIISIGANEVVLSVEEVTVEFNGGFTTSLVCREVSSLFEDYIVPSFEIIVLYDDGYFEFIVHNPNTSDCTLNIHYSGGNLTFSINALSYLTINSTNAPALAQSFQTYSTGNLMDAVYCNFNNHSDNTIILEMNGQ